MFLKKLQGFLKKFGVFLLRIVNNAFLVGSRTELLKVDGSVRFSSVRFGLVGPSSYSSGSISWGPSKISDFC